jgi:hypothetical protein
VLEGVSAEVSSVLPLWESREAQIKLLAPDLDLVYLAPFKLMFS